MNDKTSLCRPDQIQEFMSGNLSEEDAVRLENHLDGCESCRNALEASVASADVWDSVRSLNADVSRRELQSSDAPDENNLDYYRSMLGPTDDPRMLGRIGSYEIVGLLGSGGMGIVFKGYDAALNRYVAIKVLAPHFASNIAAKQRFMREAQAAAAVTHDNVIAIHSVANYLQTTYLVMPYIAGVSLQQRIAESGALGLRETLRIGLQVASGLAAAHAQGLIHRDVKPANILMENGVDRVVLTDFGIACAVDDVRLTQTDSLIGTPQYMSPEQASDQPLDYRTDLFSLGSVLYETCTARPAFQAATSYGVLRKLSEKQPSPLREINPDVPAWFERFIHRLMVKNPGDRFDSAADVERILKQCLAHVEQPTLVELPSEVAVPAARRFPLPMWSLVMLTLLAVSLVTASTFLHQVSTGDSETTKPKVQDSAEVVQDGTTEPKKGKYQSAKEAFGVGVAFYNARNFKEAQEPLEAFVQMTDDPKERLKAYRALMQSYRLLPEFEPFQKAAEYVIDRTESDAERSLTRSSYISFAYQRGQLDNLAKRYEARLAEDRDDYLSVFVLSEIYTSDDRNPKRAIELLQQLEKLNAAKKSQSGPATPPVDSAEGVKIAREKAKLARQYSQANEHLKAAELYVEIAPLDSTTHAWNLKDAAAAYLKAGNNEKALEMAEAAEKAKPEARNDQLTHFFHRNLGDVFMQLGKPKQAIPHFEIAVQKTNIEGYVKDTKASLQEAIELSKK